MQNAEPLIAVQIAAFQEREASDRGIWDLCQNSAVLIGTTGEAVSNGGLGIELIDAIPIPDKSVPLNEILEFKRRRENEFGALRAEIDNFAHRINSSDDPQAELRSAIERIDNACAAALKVSTEWQFPIHVSNRKITLDLKPFEIIAGGTAAFLGANLLGASQAVLAGIAGATVAAKSSIKITGDIGWRGLRPRSTPFAYIAQIRRELF